ncbi:hypothetical protein T11_15781 [Trichinella zimbabwensis]|uniref:Uncharacterized protein n=1 Tax=Trichinella zimbabwensis TaxID=268475 RepID=A0A0V1GWZ1_9BILA|nr:hypothetical protein T11_17882 [Trichinella zimbabwensis]KRZ02685.1 hypothetical protein T11_15781 [Trichinella zimbabwensis]
MEYIPWSAKVNKGQLWSASEMGNAHCNPLRYLLNLKASSFPLFRRRIQRLAKASQQSKPKIR